MIKQNLGLLVVLGIGALFVVDGNYKSDIKGITKEYLTNDVYTEEEINDMKKDFENTDGKVLPFNNYDKKMEKHYKRINETQMELAKMEKYLKNIKEDSSYDTYNQVLYEANLLVEKSQENWETTFLFDSFYSEQKDEAIKVRDKIVEKKKVIDNYRIAKMKELILIAETDTTKDNVYTAVKYIDYIPSDHDSYEKLSKQANNLVILLKEQQ